MKREAMENYLARVQRKHARARALANLEEDLPMDLRGPVRPFERQAKQWLAAVQALGVWCRKRSGADGIMLLGAVGRGKSKLLATLCYMAADLHGLDTLYVPCKTVGVELRGSYGNNADPSSRTEQDFVIAARERNIIALDDVGADKATNVQRLVQVLLDVGAAEHKLVIIAANQDETDLFASLGNDQREASRRAKFTQVIFKPDDVPDYRRQRNGRT